MIFYLPDAQDLVDPSFDFETEERDEGRIRQRDDLYIHEVFSEPVVDGLLVSKGIVDGFGASGGRYTTAQRNRLLSEGARRFFRLQSRSRIRLMGDCGAFTYVLEKVPPYSVDEVVGFYERCGFDFGVSVDHVILDFNPDWDVVGEAAPGEVRERQELTLDLASEFLKKCRSSRVAFTPIGVAQGWSPASYARAVKRLQSIGYTRIALGGMVPLRTTEILATLDGIASVRAPKTQLHLLGVSRTEHIQEFQKFGVVSFDSTSPLRQSFKDDKDNYHTPTRHYTALRVPQADANPKFQRAIGAGHIDQGEARSLERSALAALRGHSSGRVTTEKALKAILVYEELFLTADPSRSRRRNAPRKNLDAYRRLLEDRPWKKCPCAVCRQISHHVVLFRGAERNRRRGFHNVWTLYRKLDARR